MLCTFLKIMKNCSVDFKYSTTYKYKTESVVNKSEYIKINNSILFCLLLALHIKIVKRRKLTNYINMFLLGIYDVLCFQ